jgi:hypothetical protein
MYPNEEAYQQAVRDEIGHALERDPTEIEIKVIETFPSPIILLLCHCTTDTNLS